MNGKRMVMVMVMVMVQVVMVVLRVVGSAAAQIGLHTCLFASGVTQVRHVLLGLRGCASGGLWLGLSFPHAFLPLSLFPVSFPYSCSSFFCFHSCPVSFPNTSIFPSRFLSFPVSFFLYNYLFLLFSFFPSLFVPLVASSFLCSPCPHIHTLFIFVSFLSLSMLPPPLLLPLLFPVFPFLSSFNYFLPYFSTPLSNPISSFTSFTVSFLSQKFPFYIFTSNSAYCLYLSLYPAFSFYLLFLLPFFLFRTPHLYLFLYLLYIFRFFFLLICPLFFSISFLSFLPFSLSKFMQTFFSFLLQPLSIFIPFILFTVALLFCQCVLIQIRLSKF